MKVLTWDAINPDRSHAFEVMENGDMVAPWPNWEWQVPMGSRSDRERSLYQNGRQQVVVRISWPTGCYTRRLQTYEGDTLCVSVKPSRPLPHVDRNEGWHDPDDREENIYHEPPGSPRDIQALGMAWARESGPTTEADRTCHRIPADGGLLQLGAEARAAWSNGGGVSPPAHGSSMDLEDTMTEEEWANFENWFHEITN